MARPLAPREMRARGNHLSDAESAQPGVGGSPTHQSAELAPVPSRQGGHSPIEAGACVSADQLLQATQARGHPPTPTPRPGWACLCEPSHVPRLSGPAELSPGLTLIQGPTPPASSPASSPSAQTTPESSLLPNVEHTGRPLGICTCCFLLVQMQLPSHLPLLHCCSQPSSKVSSLRQYQGRVTDVPGAVQGSHGSPNHPNPS